MDPRRAWFTTSACDSHIALHTSRLWTFLVWPQRSVIVVMWYLLSQGHDLLWHNLIQFDYLGVFACWGVARRRSCSLLDCYPDRFLSILLFPIFDIRQLWLQLSWSQVPSDSLITRRIVNIVFLPTLVRMVNELFKFLEVRQIYIFSGTILLGILTEVRHMFWWRFLLGLPFSVTTGFL